MSSELTSNCIQKKEPGISYRLTQLIQTQRILWVLGIGVARSHIWGSHGNSHRTNFTLDANAPHMCDRSDRQKQPAYHTDDSMSHHWHLHPFGPEKQLRLYVHGWCVSFLKHLGQNANTKGSRQPPGEAQGHPKTREAVRAN